MALGSQQLISPGLKLLALATALSLLKIYLISNLSEAGSQNEDTEDTEARPLQPEGDNINNNSTDQGFNSDLIEKRR